MSVLRFEPRLLFLSADPALVRAQLEGRALTLDAARPLRDDISTDEITPLPVMVHFDTTLGRFAHTGFEAGGERPIGRDALRNAGVEVIVGGKRYGKGSSREHSVVAERAAHVRSILDNTQAFIGLLSVDGTVLEANIPALRAAGVTRERVRQLEGQALKRLEALRDLAGLAA